MASLTLRISLEGGRVTKTIQFDPNTSVFDACRIIRDKFAEAVQGQGLEINIGFDVFYSAQEYGLFLSDEGTKQGVWLEQGRNLGYYMLRNQDVLEYRRKLRTLRVRMLDGALKTILVDDSQPVTQLMVVICTKIGITNHEEYGLVREDNEQQNENLPDNKSGFSTLTLKRKTIDKTIERDSKMESLRKKLKTDDEINWIDPGKTLREQGIDEAETVLLRRKFFYSDQNIDSRDPVQLNLLYVQARDAILDGTHPVTEAKACEFAGLQAQIQFGEYNEQKHKTGFLDLKEFLPQSYVRVKNIEKKIFSEHKKHVSLSEIEAKVMYTRTARELPTYGVTFFLVKEKMPGKNKLVPRLLGVTKDSVLRLDERTKEILKTWPLTTVRRWSASPNTFTLDFGDYADSYYSVQTTEAEQIVQLIAGYIDIILKKKQSKDHVGIEGDEGSTMVEESVAPSKATYFQRETGNRGEKLNTESLAKPVIMRGSDGEKTYTHTDVQSIQYGAIVGQVNVTHQPPTLKPTRISTVLTEPQRALLGYISAGQDAISKASEELMTRADVPDIGSDPQSIEWRENTVETSKQTVTTHIATMNAATAQVVTASQPDDMDDEAIGAAVSQIAQTIPEVTREVRIIAALMEDDTGGDKLLEATRKLCNAFSDLLKAAEPESQQPRQNLLNAASRVGEASGQVLSTIGEESAESREMYDMLLGLAKAVANTTAALVLRAKAIAADCEDDDTRNRVIAAASQCALATSQLVACARVVAPTLQNEACREQLEAAAREVAKAVTNLVGICNEATDNQQLKGDLLTAAKEVSRTLTDLLEHIKLSSREHARQVTEETHAVENVLVVSDRLVTTSDPHEMVRQAKSLGHATAQLIESIKIEADQQSDSEIQRRLLSAAKQLADATAKLVEAARQCASSPNDANNQEALRNAAEELRDITTTAANTPAVKRQLIQRLEICSKHAASSARDCIASSRNAIQYSEDKQSKEILLQDCQTVNDLIPRLVNGMKTAADRPDDPSAQLGLIESSEQFLQPGAQLGQSARSLQPTVHDVIASQQLSKSAYTLSQSINELRTASSRAREACGGQELESALEAVSNMRNILNDARRNAAEGTLRPLPGETVETTAQHLGQTSKGVGIAMSQLLSSVSQGNSLYAGSAGRDTAIALGDFTKSVRGVAATTGNVNVINCADDVILSSMRLIEEAQRTLQNLGDIPSLTRAARDVTQSLTKTIDCLPGQRDVDEALKSISELSEVLTLGEYPPSDKSYGQLQEELKAAAENLNTAGGHIVHAHASPAQLASTSREFNEAYKELLTISLEMAGQTPDVQARENVVISIRGVSTSSVQLLSTAKSVAADPLQPNAKNQLAAAARAVTESINYLVDVCTSAAPGQKECENAIRTIEALRPLVESANEPLSDQGYSECFQTIVDNSKKLGDGMSGMANYAKLSQRVEFCYTVNSISEPIRGLIESAAQAAYLVGVSDPTSVAGRPGLVDQSQLARGAHAIKQSCDVLVSPSSSHQQIVTAATVIAKHTSALCNTCRLAGQYTSNPVAKREFVQAAKDLAHSTSVVVEQIKSLDKDFSTESKQRCAKATGPLLDSLNSLYQFASNPEFISVPSKISNEGRQAQEPILQAGRKVLDGSIDLVKSAKSLIVSPQNPAVWQQIAIHSRFISDNIKNIVAYMKDNAPGQTQCESALEQLGTCIRDIDSATMSIGIQGLPPRRENNLQGYTNQTLSAASELLEKLEPLRAAAKGNTEGLSHAVLQIPRYAVPLTAGTLGACSHIVHTNQQVEFLDETKTVLENATNLIHAAKKAAGISKSTISNQEIDEFIESTRESTHELISTLEKISTENGVVTGLMEQISRSMARISDKRQSFLGSSIDETYVNYQTRMVQNAKEIARIANEINSKIVVDRSKIPQLSVDMTQHYTQLAQDSMGAASTTSTPDVAIRIRNAVQDLGHSVSSIIQSSVGARTDASGQYPDVQRNARDVSEKVSQVLAALHAGSRGTQACINAVSTVSGIIGDLDTTIMFATAGTLNSENEGQFADHRELILKTAKALVEDTKVLVTGAAGTQDQLAAAAQNAVATISQLAEAVKRGACSLGSEKPDSQVMVISAVKDVAAALGELINATKLASGKPIHDPAMHDLKESARIMVMNVTSLLKTVKAVEDEHTRGTRAMEATVEAIAQEIRTLNSQDTARGPPATPEDLVRATKNVTFATAKAVAAGASNLQSDIAAAANNGRRAISEMLIICKSVAYNCAETVELRNRTLEAGAAVGNSYRNLLEGVLKGCTADERMFLSKHVAKCVTDLVAMAQLLKGSDWVDPEDPTVIAENELLGAAASIDAAAKKLANLRPRQQQTNVKDIDENMKFDEIILEAAKGIMAASSALVRAANAAQRELIDQGKVAKRPLTSSDDGQWSEGLISAARLVAAATHSLVEAAQNLVQGLSTEELLISTAKQVASSTAQLLIACRVKSDPNSESGRRLQAAGNAVIKSTDNLVRAAQQALDMEEEHTLRINTSMVDGMAQEINARSEVLKRERELELARNKLTAIRQAKYKQRVAQGYTDESDNDQYQQGYQSPTPAHHLNRSFNATPPSPSFANTSASTTYSESPQKRSNLIGVSVPRPYMSTNNDSSSPISGSRHASGHSPNVNRSYDSTSSSGFNHSTSSINHGSSGLNHGTPGNNAATSTLNPEQKSNLEACIQDLHEKTFGKTNVAPMTTYKYTTKTSSTNQSNDSFPPPPPPINGQNYEGFTSRLYETRSYDNGDQPPPPQSSINSMSNIDSKFSQMNLISNDGNVSLIDGGGSTRLNQMTQRVLERKTMTTTTESRMETKSEKHNFRLE